jgi:hypothetical protein
VRHAATPNGKLVGGACVYGKHATASMPPPLLRACTAPCRRQLRAHVQRSARAFTIAAPTTRARCTAAAQDTPMSTRVRSAHVRKRCCNAARLEQQQAATRRRTASARRRSDTVPAMNGTQQRSDHSAPVRRDARCEPVFGEALLLTSAVASKRTQPLQDALVNLVIPRQAQDGHELRAHAKVSADQVRRTNNEWRKSTAGCVPPAEISSTPAPPGSGRR